MSEKYKNDEHYGRADVGMSIRAQLDHISKLEREKEAKQQAHEATDRAQWPDVKATPEQNQQVKAACKDWLQSEAKSSRQSFQDYGNPVKVGADMGPIAKEVALMGQLAGSIASLINRLEGKLAPVLRGVTPAAAEGLDYGGDKTGVPLADELKYKNYVLGAIASQIKALIELVAI